VLELILGIIGLVIAVVTLVFTDQRGDKGVGSLNRA
jgi:hypothetical protein